MKKRSTLVKDAEKAQLAAEHRADVLEGRQDEAEAEANEIVSRCEAIITGAHALYSIEERHDAAVRLAADAHRVIGYAKRYGRNSGEERTGKGLRTQTDNMERRLNALESRDER